MSSTSRKIAVVTGASSGIGAIYADRLAQRGYDLVLVARRADRLRALAATIAAAHGVQVEPLSADLGTEAGQESVAHLLATNPAISVLVNNAGVARLTPIEGSSVADLSSQVALNITALARLTHAALPGFKLRNEGTIINIASVLGLHSLAISSVYSGTKAFVVAFTRGLEQELAGTGVKVQAVLPAATATELWDPSGVPLSALAPETVMQADAMVDAALFALDQGESLTMPSVAEADLIERYEAARVALFGASQTGTVAPRLRGPLAH
ncbi:SDR family NAD(P)-dependent oxidoreductase [Massilia sp. CCM 8695]|uniref:SDR family NAD(P)-dependent oxidoreductase n=1 Tax=Massilia frigida TaxID=2609281 RepID=A0ABX0N574_9BURK|nr:SDR family oxidoreductase [Massilia frigida]NHZ79558.1 SDR family NAD(P)-dependent oxidoreductase [Massilia frigida]